MDWTRLACIGLEFDDSVIQTIEYDYPHMTERPCEEMFRRWLRGEGCQPVTWERLLEGINDSEYGELARKIRKLFSP